MFSKFFARPLFGGTCLGIACALLVWSLSHTSPVVALEDWALDTCFVQRGARTTSARVVIVAIDDRSLSELHKPYAFLRPELAEVVLHLNKQGAAAIGIDVMVPDDMKDLPEIAGLDGRGAAAPMGDAVKQADNVVLPQRRLEGPGCAPSRSGGPGTSTPQPPR
jgi:CHASE2 domain-containing sensor protein